MYNSDCLAVIEMPQGTSYKYEYHNNELHLDRALAIPVPHNYGYIENTLSPDGDALDIFVLSQNNEPILTGAKVKVKIVAGLKCTDNGDSDDKLIGIIANEGPIYTPDLKDISYYLTTYKTGFVVEEELNEEQALKVLEESKIKDNNFRKLTSNFYRRNSK